MKLLIYSIILISFFFVLGYRGMGLIDKHIIAKGSVLSRNTNNEPVDLEDILPSPSVTPSATATPSPTNTPYPTKIPQPTPTLQPKYTSQEIQIFIERFSAQYAVDANVLRHIAVCESGFNPEAVNGSYVGLFQFMSVTWKNNRAIMGEDINPDLRYDAEESVQTAAYMISQGRRDIWPNCYP